MHYLYKITNVLSGKIYIGQSNKEKERWRQHKYFARQENPVQYVHRAMAKYGVDNFIYEVIAMCRTQEDADETEAQLIIQYDSRNKKYGYNRSPGGDLCWNRGLPTEQQPMYGKRQSEYFLQRMSEVHTGKTVIHSKKTKQKISESCRGIAKSDEWKKKNSGENHHNSKLTWVIVNSIREDYKDGMSQVSLVHKYKYSKSTINKVVLKKSWI